MKWPYVARWRYEQVVNTMYREQDYAERLQAQLIELTGRSGLLPKQHAFATLGGSHLSICWCKGGTK